MDTNGGRIQQPETVLQDAVYLKFQVCVAPLESIVYVVSVTLGERVSKDHRRSSGKWKLHSS